MKAKTSAPSSAATRPPMRTPTYQGSVQPRTYVTPGTVDGPIVVTAAMYAPTATYV